MRIPVLILVSSACVAAACGHDEAVQPAPPAPACAPSLDVAAQQQDIPEQRDACAEHDELRRPYFGDLHVHTYLSFDAYTEDVRTTPAEAYAFARGQAISIPPLGPDGKPTQKVQLARPLDFAAVTDHAEFLGEVLTCSTPGDPGYDSETCKEYRQGGFTATRLMGTRLSNAVPERAADVCGADGAQCAKRERDGWQELQSAAEAAYDRTSACAFTSLVAYEWSGATGVSNLHRNVIFRDDHVPAAPISYIDEPTAAGLWSRLTCECPGSIPGCRVLAIPHNSNLSNGKMFSPTYQAPDGIDAQRALAKTRAAMEPLMEVFQHKGTSECDNGLSGVVASPDPLCAVEQLRPVTDDCGDGTGTLGMLGAGCVSRWDFARGALLAGLTEQQRLGVNPYRLGLIGSTDTHVGTPGATDEQNFAGHIGSETTPATRLSTGNITTAIEGNPGGLVGVWAVENSRHAIFDALLSREAFGTSGTRIVPRVFGGWSLAQSECQDPDMVKHGYADGVPMGGTLPARSGDQAPVMLVSALRDPDPGAGDLDMVQIVKGWVGADGTPHYQVYDAAKAGGSAGVDDATCQRTGSGAASLCTAWTDPDFDPALPAYYYARIVEVPSCRWSRIQCLALPQDSTLPEGCTDPAVPHTIREMAWTSPIWYQP